MADEEIKVQTYLRGSPAKRWEAHLKKQEAQFGKVTEADEARKAVIAYLDSLYGKED